MLLTRVGFLAYFGVGPAPGVQATPMYKQPLHFSGLQSRMVPVFSSAGGWCSYGFGFVVGLIGQLDGAFSLYNISLRKVAEGFAGKALCRELFK